ncbi:MAG TPA: AMP-binding protein [Pyrinomonadaceae bacterium]
MRKSLLEYFYDLASDESDIAFSHRPGLRRKRWSYAELARTSFQFARELEARAIGEGDRVLIWAENSPEWVAAFYGTILRGAIAVPLDEQSSPDFVARVCEQTEPRLLLHGQGIDHAGLNLESISLEHLRKRIQHHPSHHYPANNIQPANTVEIVFTSGTTATPKGVVLTHENILANLEPMEREINKYLRWEFLIHPLRILTVLPLSHVFGQMIGIFIPQMLRAEVFFQNRLNPTEIIETIKRERVMVLGAVPRVLETLRHKIEREYETRHELDELRESMKKERSWLGSWWTYRRAHRLFGVRFLSFITGGATLDESTEIFWRRLGFGVVQGYGMTETAALISLNNPFSARRRSLGQILAGRKNVKIGEKGEILVRGRNISPGYWGDQRGGKTDEWLDTGDIGEMDETGRLYFKGRKKDVIVTAAGLNIFPEDLEAVLNAQTEIIASVVVGVDTGAGPEPAAALILRPGSNASAIVERANKNLADYQQIREWIEWPDADFPRTPTQKIRKNVVAEIVERQLGTRGRRSQVSGSPLASIIARLGAVVPDSVSKDARLNEDLNLDSLSRVELMSAIEDRYQIELDEQAFTESTTVGELEQMIRAGEGVDEVEQIRFSYPRWPLRFPVSWIRPVFYELVIYPITRMLSWVNKRGVENLSDLNGPVVFASNHVTYVDPALVMSAMPLRFRSRLAIAIDGERLRGYRYGQPGIGLIMRIRWFFTYWLVVAFFNAFPLPRRSGFRKSFVFAGEAMDRGYNILIFPEGELTKDGRLQKFRTGVGLLASGLEAPIVPVSISGLYELRRSGQRGYAPPGSITITFGEPIPYEADASPQDITQNLERRIAALEQ